MTWWDYRSGNGDVYAQHILVSGNVDPAWPVDGLSLCTAPDGQVPGSIVADGSGGAIVVWADLRNGDDIDVYAQHVLASGMVDPSWPVDGRALASGPALQGNPKMVGDGAGGAIVAWTDAHRGPDGYYVGTYDIYAQHVLVSGDLDPAWPASGLAVCTAPDDQLLAGMVTDGAGGAIVAWLDLRSGYHPRDVYAQHIMVSGVSDPAWPADGLAICTAPSAGGRNSIAIAADGTGGAILTWQDYQTTSYEIYAHHVRRSGVLDPAWPTDGRALCNAGDDQTLPLIAGEAVGRAIVVWLDYRNGDYDIYALRVFTQSAAAPRGPHAVEKPGLRIVQGDHSRDEITIRFEVAAKEQVSIEVFDTAGRAVRTLVDRQELTAGTHGLSWDGVDRSGRRLPRGVYLVRVSLGAQTVTGKALLLK